MKKSTIITFIVGILILIVVVVALAKNAANNPTTSQNNSSSSTEQPEVAIDDIKVGSGDEAVPGKEVTVHYVGTLENGYKFDSSRDRKEPFSFTLGRDNVIQGWHDGVEGMKVGGTRKLTIPPELGYGSQANNDIPANSTLIFEIELLKVE